MSQLEQVLFKTYTDPVFRQNIQNGTEKLEGLSEDERTAVLALSTDEMNNSTEPSWWCDRRE
jgi:hypothetical protein